MDGTQRPTKIPWSFEPVYQRVTDRTRDRKAATMNKIFGLEKTTCVDSRFENTKQLLI
jgi:hypothetical protein